MNNPITHRATQSYHATRNYLHDNPIKFLLFLACIGVFLKWPNLDIGVSSLLYSPDRGFFWADLPPVAAMHWLFGKIHFAYLIILASFLLLPFCTTKIHRALDKKSLRYLLVMLLIGPGLLVNIVLKDNSTGRARPDQVIEFGGENTFTPPFKMANQCDHNCSFVSGHASAGFFIMSFAWAFRSKRWLYIGVATGVCAGLGRLLQGDHFLSDIIFCFWAMYFTMSILGRAYGFTVEPQAEQNKAKVNNASSYAN